MMYKDIYTSDFLDKFGEYKDKIAKLELGNPTRIDVKAIAESCNIPIEYNVLESSSCWSNDSKNDNTDKLIQINKFEPEYRQRFTIAHELGHILLGHQGISYRTSDMTKYKDTIRRMNEVAANKFAAELTMPKSLVIDVLFSSIKQMGYSINQRFGDEDISKIVQISANELGVSPRALDIRIKNLGIFVNAK
ncbi:ImmA/IrrE family metallo-endopeptidase [Fannyhessea vaginae]|uniref:ImmA/IrrE family metallo-endopeptidase n=1 Tax=Fannyhessea vaginae TaxID=82135 RepID=UPI003A805D28